MTRSVFRGLVPAVAAVSALGLAGGAWAAKPLPTVQQLVSHSPLVPLPFISPPPRLHRAMKWTHTSSSRELAMRFTSTQDHAVVGLVRPGDARAVASAYGVTVVALDTRLHMMEVKAAPETLDKLAHAASWDRRLRFVEPLVHRQYQHLHNDPALTQTDPVTMQPYEWNFGATHTDLAYNLSKGSPTMLVGVIDTGISEVPDLKGKIAETWYFNYQTTSSDDIDGHGTAVSSIIAANADDGVGIAGFGGAARIDMYRDVGLDGFSDAVAIRFLVDRGVRIINMSWGGGNLSSPERDALNYASDAGVLLVAAIGNNGSSQAIWPAQQVQAAGGVAGPGLSVGASTDTGVRVNFSNYGPNLSLIAPGAFADNDCADGIYLPLPPVADLFDGNQCIRFFTDPQTNARHGYLRGTSFAAPEVAGAAALLWAARPFLKNFEVATLLQHGVDPDRRHRLEPERRLGRPQRRQVARARDGRVVRGQAQSRRGDGPRDARRGPPAHRDGRLELGRRRCGCGRDGRLCGDGRRHRARARRPGRDERQGDLHLAHAGCRCRARGHGDDQRHRAAIRAHRDAAVHGRTRRRHASEGASASRDRKVGSRRAVALRRDRGHGLRRLSRPDPAREDRRRDLVRGTRRRAWTRPSAGERRANGRRRASASASSPPTRCAT